MAATANLIRSRPVALRDPVLDPLVNLRLDPSNALSGQRHGPGKRPLGNQGIDLGGREADAVGHLLFA
jgi:hypothetical protein